MVAFMFLWEFRVNKLVNLEGGFGFKEKALRLADIATPYNRPSLTASIKYDLNLFYMYDKSISISSIRRSINLAISVFCSNKSLKVPIIKTLRHLLMLCHTCSQLLVPF